MLFLIMLALALTTFVATAVAFSPARTMRMTKASSLMMTSTIVPTETSLTKAARDARGLAIDSISAVSPYISAFICITHIYLLLIDIFCVQFNYLHFLKFTNNDDDYLLLLIHIYIYINSATLDTWVFPLVVLRLVLNFGANT